MNREKLIRLPVIYDAGGDIAKDWFVEFYCKNPRTGDFERIKKYKGINKFHMLPERREAIEKMCQYWTDKLRSGWSPFLDEKIIYDDNLEYNTLIKNYKKAVSHNGTFRFYASKFLDNIRSSINEDGTLSTYRSKLRMFDAWLEGKGISQVDISEINQPLMVEFFSFLIEDLQRSRITVRHYQQILRKVFEFIRKERKVFQNPCFDLPTTKRINDQTPQPIQEYDIKKFKDAIQKSDPQLWLAICFEYYCFLRPGKEIRLLKIGDIDFGRGIVRVNPINSKTVERHIPIPRQFLTMIREDYKLHSYPRNDYVIGRNGVPGPTSLGKNNLRYRFNNIREELGMPEMYKLYSWKHTGNIRADDAGIPRSEIQRQNGHSSIVTTENYMKNKKGFVSKNIVERFPGI